MSQLENYFRRALLHVLPFWPLHVLLKAYYHAAIRLAVFLLKRIPDIQAVYVTGSFARDEVIYGLSDIDLTVFFNNRGTGGSYNRIYVVLRGIYLAFPMFGDVSEKGIFPVESFLSDWRNSRSMQYLFDDNFHPHQLVWGRDVLKELHPQMLGGYSPCSVYAGRFDYWMGVLFKTLPGEVKNGGIPAYCLYKAFRDVFLVYLKLREPSYAAIKEGQAVEQGSRLAQAYMTVGEKIILQRLVAARENAFLDWRGEVDETFDLLRKLMALCYQEMQALLGQGASGYFKPAAGISHLEPFATDRFEAAIEKQIEAIPGLIDCPVLLRRYANAFVPLPFNRQKDFLLFGLPLLIVSVQRPLQFSEWLQLRRLIHTSLHSRVQVLVQDHDHDEYFLRGYFDIPLSGETGAFISKLFEPAFFYLQEKTMQQADFAVCGGQWKTWLEIDLDRMRSQASRRALMVFSPAEFYPFVFSLLQKLVFAAALEKGQFFLPPGPAELCEFLQAETCVPAKFLEKLQAMLGAGSQADPVAHARFFESAFTFVHSLLDAHAKGRPFRDIQLKLEDDEHGMASLSISVIVATRSRENDLRNCLQSLVALDRKADEVVVIDNGSTDGTRAMVEGFREHFPLKYVYTEKYGMAAVRNEGVRAATKDLLAFIDDDAVADPRWLNFIEKTFLLGEDIGIVGGRIETMKKDRTDLAYRYSRMVDLIGEIVLKEME
jgi:Glycosyl transferase family 2/Nucleotidyltransferase domain